MNRQSDHGYTTGGCEHRTPELCASRAAFCDRLAAEFPQYAHNYKRWAAEWRAEGAAYPRAAHLRSFDEAGRAVS